MTTQMSSDRREAYQKRVKAEFDKLSAQIAEYQAKADQSKASASAEYHKQVEQLIAKRDEAQSQLQKLQQTSSDAWDELQVGFEKAWNDLSDAFQRASDKASQS